MARPSLATFVVALAGAMWGVWWIPLRTLEAGGIVGDWASALLFGAGSAAFALLLLALRRPFGVSGAAFWVVGLLAGGGWSLWNHALITGDVVRVTLLFYLSPIWATLLARLILGEPFGWLRGLSILCGLTGATVVLGFASGFPVPRTEGEWMGLAAGIAFSFATIAIRRFASLGAMERALASLLGAFLVSLLFAAWTGLGVPAPATIVGSLPLVGLCLFWLVPLNAMIMWGIGRLDPGRVNVLLLLEVVTAALSAAILTDEPFGWREVAGCILIIGAGAIEGVGEMREQSAARHPA